MDRTFIDDEPIHGWFGLSYASYLTLQRSVLQSMPLEWQRRFVKCLEELDEAAADLSCGSCYCVLRRDANGRFIHDPFADYERGRRRIALRGVSK